MPGLVIEREILIEAPVEVVWRTITEPDQVSQWFAERVGSVLEPGARGPGSSGTRAARSSWGSLIHGSLQVQLEPSARGGSRAGNSMLVEFTLTPKDDERTRLRVVESGHELLAWPDAEKQRYADEHQGGWAGPWTAWPRCSRNADSDASGDANAGR